MFLPNPLAEAYRFRGEAGTFNHLIKAALAMYLLSSRFLYARGSLRYTKNMIQKGKVLPLSRYTRTPFLLKSLHLLYPWGLGLPGRGLNAREFPPHPCVLIKTMFDWKTLFMVATGSRAIHT